MNPRLGGLLAVIAVALGAWLWGWRGAALAASVTVFWMLLQFSRALRAMRHAASAPVGHIDSAVMLNARLRPGLSLVQVVALTRSLGVRVGEAPETQTETWAWTDAGGARVTLTMAGARLASWVLTRAADDKAGGESMDAPAA
jgi:hypothetical protein